MKGTGLGEEYENKNNHRLANEEQLCCDEKSPCVLNDYNNSNVKDLMIVDATNNNAESHKGKNCHSKNRGQQSVKELNIEHLKPDLESKIIEELERSHREQLILLKEYKQTIIDFIIDNKDSIRIEDLKIYEPIYKCYREKGNCYICNDLTNIVCYNCSNYKNEVWLCMNHWKQHLIQHHQYIE